MTMRPPASATSAHAEATSRSDLVRVSGIWSPLPVPTPARRLDDEDIARPHLGLVAPLQPVDPSVRPLDPLVAAGAGPAAGEAEGGYLAVVGEEGGRHRFEEADLADRAVAALVAALAARAAVDAVADQHHRVAPLE